MSRPRSRLPVLAAAIAAATALTACGASSSTSSSSSAASSSSGNLTYAQAQQDAVNFAHCVRLHGVPGFPDPSSPREFKISMAPGTTLARSPAFQSAAAACQHLLGGTPRGVSPARSQAQIAAMLAFAGCMRTHGFSSFPDPTSTGEMTREMLASAGIDLHQPAVVGAADACVGVTHGFITRIDVARFIAGQ